MRHNTTYQTLTRAEFESAIASIEGITLVEFGAEWCGGCQLMSLILKSIINRLKIKIELIKIDIENDRAIKSIYDISAQPTYLIFLNGKMIDRITGIISRSEFELKIDSYINEITIQQINGGSK